MGFRFRRSVKILPGIRLNFSKSGVSTTLGPRGATVSVGKRGPRANVGIPGTGISYSTALGGRKHQKGTQQPGATPTSPASSGCGLAAVIGVVVFAIATCSKDTTPPSDPLAAAPAVLKTGYVSARSLNCRAVPDTSATVVTGLSRGSTLSITEESGTWSKVENGGQTCWVSSQFVSDTPPPPAAEQSRPSRAGLLATGGAAAYAGTIAKSGKSRRNRKRQQRALDRYDSQGCPCSGSQICIGPRGGRYCITSGGNKRYGV